MNWFKSKEPQALPRDLDNWEPGVTYPSAFQQDALGNRLDHARRALAQCATDTWAETYWQTTVNALVRKWQRLMVESHVGVHRNLVPESWSTRHDWIEDDLVADIPQFSIYFIDQWFDRTRIQQGLELSWARAQEDRYQNALKGFV